MLSYILGESPWEVYNKPFIQSYGIIAGGSFFIPKSGGASLDSNKEWVANRDSDGIVYCFADGTTQTICLDDYLRINPEYTAEDFYKIKELSDTLFLEQKQADHIYGSKKSDTDFETAAAMLPSPEPEPSITVLCREQRRIAIRAAKTLLHSGKLSPVQKRRFIAYFFCSKSVSEIARTEKVNRSSIWRGLSAAVAYLQHGELAR